MLKGCFSWHSSYSAANQLRAVYLSLSNNCSSASNLEEAGDEDTCFWIQLSDISHRMDLFFQALRLLVMFLIPAWLTMVIFPVLWLFIDASDWSICLIEASDWLMRLIQASYWSMRMIQASDLSMRLIQPYGWSMRITQASYWSIRLIQAFWISQVSYWSIRLIQTLRITQVSHWSIRLIQAFRIAQASHWSIRLLQASHWSSAGGSVQSRPGGWPGLAQVLGDHLRLLPRRESPRPPPLPPLLSRLQDQLHSLVPTPRPLQW